MKKTLPNRITIRLSPLNASGKKLVIKTVDNGPASYYVQAATFNGKPLEENWLYRKEILSGGELILRMGPEPSGCWDRSHPPVSR